MPKQEGFVAERISYTATKYVDASERASFKPMPETALYGYNSDTGENEVLGSWEVLADGTSIIKHALAKAPYPSKSSGKPMLGSLVSLTTRGLLTFANGTVVDGRPAVNVMQVVPKERVAVTDRDRTLSRTLNKFKQSVGLEKRSPIESALWPAAIQSINSALRIAGESPLTMSERQVLGIARNE